MDTTRKHVKVAFIAIFASLIGGASSSAYAQASTDPALLQNREEFRLAYQEMAREKGFEPSAFALRLALAEGERDWEGLAAGEAARLAYEHAYRFERALRTGSTAQEAQAQTRQRIRLESRLREGDGTGDADRLQTAERLRTRLGTRLREGEGSGFYGAGGHYGANAPSGKGSGR
jgi:hypothetical protein